MTEPIARIKISLTSDCNLRCAYCAIDKDRGERADVQALLAALTPLLRAGGSVALIGLYGGEPMADYAAVSAIIAKASRLAGRLGKELRFSMATNGLLLERRHLRFLRARGVEVCISVDGPNRDERMFADGRGSFEAVAAKLKLVFAEMPGRKLTALQGVHPGNAARFEENFRAILGLGFTNVNLEMIQGPPWNEQARGAFVRGFASARRILLSRAMSTAPIFLQSVNRALALAAGAAVAPAVELLPSGAPSRTPYPFVHVAAGARASLAAGARMVECRDRLSLRLAKELLSRRGARAYRVAAARRGLSI